MDSTFEDKEFGIVVFRENGRLKRLSLAVSEGRIIVRVPQNVSFETAVAFLDKNREWVRKVMGKNHGQKRDLLLSPEKEFHAFSFSVSYFVSNSAKLYGRLSVERGVLTIYYPQGFVFDDALSQKKLRGIVGNALLIEARRILPEWLSRVASRIGLTYSSCKVLKMKSRWGSCSASDDIHLSSSLLLLPEDLIEFVMIHELCHTVEKNHSRRFHNWVDLYTSGREKELIQKMKNYVTFKE